MKSFFKNLISSCLGTILGILILLVTIGIVLQIYIAKDKPNQKGVLYIPISGQVTDYTSASLDFSPIQSISSSPTLWDLRNKIKAASEDENISGIVLDLKQSQISQSSTLEIMNYLQSFKESGKKIYAYSYFYGQNTYLLSTIADSIFLNPNGGVELKGYGMYAPFFNNILEKLEIDINIFYAGKYKGGTEPYRLDGFSDENKFQLRVYLLKLHQLLVNTIGRNRNIPKYKVESIISAQNDYDAEQMMKNRIVDRLMHEDEFNSIIERDFKSHDEVSFKDYEIKAKESSKTDIAIVFAEGEVTWGKGNIGTMSHEKYKEIFREIREDDNIKAVIVRFNSPGGSGYASDLLHREITMLRNTGKKVYASLGSMATSGAYYIAAACDSIFTNENSMTGSIGVYIMLPTFDKFLENQVGLTVDSVTTAANTISYNAIFPISENEKKNLIQETEDLYQQFLLKVANGRKMSIDSVQTIAQGRIWTGEDAIRIGLADVEASLDQSLTIVQKINNLSGKSVDIYPKQNVSLADRLIEKGFQNLMFSNKNEVNFIKSKTIEAQKLMNSPSPSMSFPHPYYVINR